MHWLRSTWLHSTRQGPWPKMAWTLRLSLQSTTTDHKVPKTAAFRFRNRWSRSNFRKVSAMTSSIAWRHATHWPRSTGFCQANLWTWSFSKRLDGNWWSPRCVLVCVVFSSVLRWYFPRFSPVLCFVVSGRRSEGEIALWKLYSVDVVDWIIISFEQVEDAAKYDNLQTTYVRPKRSSATDKVVNTFSQVTQLIQLLLPGLGG